MIDTGAFSNQRWRARSAARTDARNIARKRRGFSSSVRRERARKTRFLERPIVGDEFRWKFFRLKVLICFFLYMKVCRCVRADDESPRSVATRWRHPFRTTNAAAVDYAPHDRGIGTWKINGEPITAVYAHGRCESVSFTVGRIKTGHISQRRTKMSS